MSDANLEAFLEHKNKLYEMLMDSFEIYTKKYKEGNLELPPDIHLLDLSNKFLKKYRQTGNKDMLEISVIIRRAAHKTHWKMIKLKYTKKNNKFINMV